MLTEFGGQSETACSAYSCDKLYGRRRQLSVAAPRHAWGK